MDDILKIHLQSDPELTVINFIGNDLKNFKKKDFRSTYPSKAKWLQ
jgi:hypothetical protein